MSSADLPTPILAGILAPVPWMKQWHNKPDAETGERLRDAYDSWFGEELRIHGLSRADFQPWARLAPRQEEEGQEVGPGPPMGRRDIERMKSSGWVTLPDPYIVDSILARG